MLVALQQVYTIFISRNVVTISEDFSRLSVLLSIPLFSLFDMLLVTWGWKGEEG